MSELKEQKKTAIKGGEFLVKETNCKDVFIPEEWSEEQKMIAQMCDDFINQEVYPVIDRIDAMEEGLMVSLPLINKQELPPPSRFMASTQPKSTMIFAI